MDYLFRNSLVHLNIFVHSDQQIYLFFGHESIKMAGIHEDFKSSGEKVQGFSLII